jgi:hypothetical protein
VGAGDTQIATVTDILETIFVIKGAEELVGGTLAAASAMDVAAKSESALAAAQAELNAAQTALLAPITAMIAETTQLAAVLVNNVAGFGAMAAAEGLATAATVTLESALALLESPLVIIAAALATLTAGVAIAAKGLSEFSKSEDQIARVAIQMKNLGDVFPISELSDFSERLSNLTGIDDEVITSLGVAAAQFGLTRKQIEQDLPKILDIAQANKISPEQAFGILKRAAGGRTQGLRALNINPDAIKGDLHDINNLINQVGSSFTGTAEAFRQTLPGTVDALHTAIGNLFEAIGRFISPVAVPLLNIFIAGIEKATALLNAIANLLHLPTAADLDKGKASPLALKGDPEQTAALKGIEENTASLQPFVKQVLGGRGTEARRAFTWRDQRLAFGI